MQPIPDNESPGNPVADQIYGFGNHQGLVVAKGIVSPIFAGNLNGGLTKNPLTLNIYTAKAGIADFLAILPELGKGPWRGFYEVARTPGDISLARPFYPAQSNRQPPASMTDLLHGLR